MSSDGKPPETTHDPLDDAFFSREPAADLAHQEPHTTHDDASITARPSGAPVASSAHDELDHAHNLAPDFDEDAVLGRKRGLHAGAFALVFLGAVLGGTAGYFALRSSSPQDAPVVKTSTSTSASSSARNVAAPTNSASAPVVVASAAPSAKSTKASTVGAQTASKGESAGFAGANAGVGLSPSDQVLAKGELSSGEISGVVERNRALIKRRCWQPEVSARQGMGGSARVNTSFTVGPSGAVQTATASGAENDYPGLSSCIAAQIRAWKFPPSASSTPVNVPFVFAAQ